VSSVLLSRITESRRSIRHRMQRTVNGSPKLAVQ
jgi:hypothetical protein